VLQTVVATALFKIVCVCVFFLFLFFCIRMNRIRQSDNSDNLDLVSENLFWPEYTSAV
jgi:hypothetical protein